MKLVCKVVSCDIVPFKNGSFGLKISDHTKKNLLVFVSDQAVQEDFLNLEYNNLYAVIDLQGLKDKSTGSYRDIYKFDRFYIGRSDDIFNLLSCTD